MARSFPSTPRAPKPGPDQNPIHPPQLSVVPIGLELLGVDVDDADLHVVGDAAVDQRLVERLVGIAELDVLADEADPHFVFRMPQLADDLFPLRQRADLVVRQVELVEQDLVEPFA